MLCLSNSYREFRGDIVWVPPLESISRAERIGIKRRVGKALSVQDFVLDGYFLTMGTLLTSYMVLFPRSGPSHPIGFVACAVIGMSVIWGSLAPFMWRVKTAIHTTLITRLTDTNWEILEAELRSRQLISGEDAYTRFREVLFNTSLQSGEIDHLTAEYVYATAGSNRLLKELEEQEHADEGSYELWVTILSELETCARVNADLIVGRLNTYEPLAIDAFADSH